MNTLYSGLGCLLLIIIAAFTLFFAKFLVPVVPVVFLILFIFLRRSFYKTNKRNSQNIQDLVAGVIKLEGSVEKIGSELASPYSQKSCVGYRYKEIKHTVTEDLPEKEILVDQTKCEDFNLNTSSGRIKIIGKELDLKQLPKLKEFIPIHNYSRTGLEYNEHLLKNGDYITIIGFASGASNRITEIFKVENKPFYVTTSELMEDQKKCVRNTYKIISLDASHVSCGKLLSFFCTGKISLRKYWFHIVRYVWASNSCSFVSLCWGR